MLYYLIRNYIGGIMLNSIQQLDDTLISFVYHNLHTPLLDKIMIFITNLGNSGAIWIALTFLFLMFKQTRKLGILLTFALLLELFICDGVLKNIFARPRPFTRFDVDLLIPSPHSYSFPSGHTASSFTAAFIIFYYERKIGALALLLAALIGFSRVYLFCHYPSDILGGIILALIISFFTIKICKLYENKLRF
jgi:undecaprenyl-diphosphatase